jgi:pyruvate dehydrogenase E1 component beta subunit
MVHTSLAAADQLTTEGIDVEVIDLRVLEPLDINTIIASIQKTSHAVILHEAWKKGGFGAELAAQIQAEAFDRLSSPIIRIGAPNVPVPYSAALESAYIPSIERVVSAVKESLEYSAKKNS